VAVSTGHPDETDVLVCSHRLGGAEGGDTGPARHGMPTLFECVGDAHALIMSSPTPEMSIALGG
jgi:hypothetical protein